MLLGYTDWSRDQIDTFGLDSATMGGTSVEMRHDAVVNDGSGNALGKKL